MIRNSKDKFFLSILFIGVSSFIYNAFYIGVMSFFLAKLGAHYLPNCLIFSGIILLLVSVFFRFLSPGCFSKNPLRSFFWYMIIMITLLILHSFIFNTVSPLAIMAFFVITFVNYNLMREFSWNVIHRFYTPFVANRNIPFLSCYGELGDILSGLACCYFFAKGSLFINYYIILILLAVAFLFLILFKLYLIRPVYFAESKEKKDYKEFIPYSWRNFVLSLAFVFFLLTFSRYILYYLFNSYIENNYLTQENIGVILGLFTAASSICILVFNLLMNVFSNNRPSYLKMAFLVLSLFIILLISCFFLPMLWVIFACEFLRKVSSGTVFYPYYRYIINTLDSIKRHIITFFWGSVMQSLAFILANLFLFFYLKNRTDLIFPLKIFLGCIIFMFLGLICFRKSFFNFHIENLDNPSLEDKIRSVDALADRGNITGAESLIKLLKEPIEKSLRKNIIFSLGQIRSQECLKEIFKQMDFSDQEVQMATLNALVDYEDLEVKAFFFKLLFSHKLKSFEARISLLRLIGKAFGKSITPILMLALKDNDERVVANTIEAIGELKSKDNIKVFLPYLNHENNRIKAQAIIALYPYRIVRRQCDLALQEMIHSNKKWHIASACYVIGRLRLRQWKKKLLVEMSNHDFDIQMNAIFSLICLNCQIAYNKGVNLLLDEYYGPKCLYALVNLPIYARIGLIEYAQLKSRQQRDILIKLFESSLFDLSEEIADLQYDFMK